MGVSAKLIIQHDTRDKIDKHRNVESYFERCGHTVIRSKMYVGDVTLFHRPTICIDLKRDLSEVVGNIATKSQKTQEFNNECQRAVDARIKLVFLVEHGQGIQSLEDVRNWENPRRAVSPYCVNGDALYRKMRAYEDKYGIEWQFCDERQTGKRIIEILCRE